MSHGELWDVVIAGGGPAGASAAIALSRGGARVLLVEATHYEAFRPGETLPPYIHVLLGELGLSPRFLGEAWQPSRAIWSAWGADDLEAQQLLTHPHGQGFHVDRRRFDEMLAGAAEEAGATVLREARVVAAEAAGDESTVSIVGADGPRRERARALVDATGRRATVARALGATTIAHDRLIGIIGLLAPASGPVADADALLLEAFEHGYFYSAPMQDGSLLVALMTDGDQPTRRGLRPELLWKEGLEETEHTRERTRLFGAVGEIHVRGAATTRLAPMAGAGWLAVGDAAAAYDPLSAEGVCKAMSQGLRAAEAIGAQLAGDAGAAAPYVARIEAEFQHYLRERARYYAMELRWPRSTFWRRRQAGVTRETRVRLDPMAVVVAPADAEASARDRAEALLPLTLIDRLMRALEAPRAAHEALSALRSTALNTVSDRDLVLALQLLIDDGALLCVDGDAAAR